MLTEKELERYSRQLVFSRIGKKGQERLKKSTVAVLGLGGMGSAISLYLVTAGINLRLIDRDVIELKNLHRQVLFYEEDIGKPKALVAKEKLEKKNSNIRIEAFHDDFKPSNAERLVKGVDIVLDGTDNMETRFLLNDVCVKNSIPFTYSAAVQDRIMFSFIIPGKTACLRCIIGEIPRSLETCETSGIVGPVPGFVGLLSAMEAIKHIVGFGEPLTNKLVHINLSKFKVDVVKVKRKEDCRTCQKKEFEFLKRKVSSE